LTCLPSFEGRGRGKNNDPVSAPKKTEKDSSESFEKSSAGCAVNVLILPFMLEVFGKSNEVEQKPCLPKKSLYQLSYTIINKKRAFYSPSLIVLSMAGIMRAFSIQRKGYTQGGGSPDFKSSARQQVAPL
jgi:hypothetical protein